MSSRSHNSSVVGVPSVHSRIGGRHRAVIALALAGCACVAATHAGAGESDAPRYRAVVYPRLDGFASAYPAAFTASGEIVGHASPKPFHPQSVAVITDGTELVALPADARAFNLALGAGGGSGDGPGGDLIAGMIGFQAAVWSDGEDTVLAPLPGHFNGTAYDINASGLVIGTQINDLIGFDFPVYWLTPESMPSELPPAGHPGAAFAVNDSGMIAGVASFNGSGHAARWDGPLADPVMVGPIAGGAGGEGRAINSAGDIAGRSVFLDFSSRAMLHLRIEDKTIDLGTLAGTYSEARGLNDARHVVGVSNAGAEAHGFLWQEGQLHDLNDLVVATNEPFAYVSLAVDIDASGRIAAEVVVGAPEEELRRIALLVPCVDADLNCDGIVDGADLGQLLSQWGGPGSGDLNGDGIVDGADLGLLLAAWG